MGATRIMVIRHAEKPGTYDGTQYDGVNLTGDIAGTNGSKDLITIGWQVNPRTLAMKAVLVPLPAPGAPPNRMISLGKRMRSWPNSDSSSRQMDPKMIWASLISRSLRLVAPGATGGGTGSVGAIIRLIANSDLSAFSLLVCG